ncbi:hypothetical protein CU669_15000 [Paramagnetospirillum kuznetsovii]|uniref:Uncharacterized protein n=1 Tax=Paramagnetospirillum kuznetsovii TaxID=2053833 RepID=A0A364NVH9_9PROT|nr:hypothetical protein [Paramagnetospirillum kuznetsovii]RAU21062.1 hypothetical protein CU669_15000 [Paramagnetospirillum kuznetsovii]
MTIDFTNPVETTETPPRPVMVLYALGNDTPYGFVVYNVTKTATDEFWLMTDENRPDIRNVPAKPVLIEGWSNVMSFGERHGSLPFSMGRVYPTRELAAAYLDDDDCYVTTIKVAWHSDGSPVEEDDTFVAQHLRKCIADRDHWKAKAEALDRDLESRILECGAAWERCQQWEAKAIKAQADAGGIINRMQAVVDAAVAWVNERETGTMPWEYANKVMFAVRAYQNIQPATSDSHEAMVEADIRNAETEQALMDAWAGDDIDAILPKQRKAALDELTRVTQETVPGAYDAPDTVWVCECGYVNGRQKTRCCKCKQPATGDSHEADQWIEAHDDKDFVKAVEEVVTSDSHEPAPPVKNCLTCRFYEPGVISHRAKCPTCLGDTWNNWQPKENPND